METVKSTRFGLTALLAVLFVLLQGFSVAHATHYSDGEHDHDGVLCVLSVLQDRNDDFISPAPSDFPKPEIFFAGQIFSPAPLCHQVLLSNASARGPPLN